MRAEAHVVFSLTDQNVLQVPALESVEQGGISNPTEAAIIHKLLSLLIKVQQEACFFLTFQTDLLM